MSTVKAYYDGLSFVPIEPVNVQKGKIVQLSLLLDDATNDKASELLNTFRKLTNEILELNKDEPLTPEFDKILKTCVNFSKEN